MKLIFITKKEGSSISYYSLVDFGINLLKNTRLYKDGFNLGS